MAKKGMYAGDSYYKSGGSKGAGTMKGNKGANAVVAKSSNKAGTGKQHKVANVGKRCYSMGGGPTIHKVSSMDY